MSKKFDMSDYVDVAERIAEFRSKHPEGCLRPADLANPYRVETVGEKSYVVVVAAAYRTPDDKLPGIGMAWEPVPGLTPYTKDSELQNAETSAWGRAIVGALKADTKRGIATQQDVANRQNGEAPAPVPDPVRARIETVMQIVESSNATSDDVVAICAELAGEGTKVADLTAPQFDELTRRLGELASVSS